MRIGFFTSIEGWGGSEIYLRNLILGSKDAGHDVILFGVKGSRLFDDLEALGVPCCAWESIGSSSAHASNRHLSDRLRPEINFWLKDKLVRLAPMSMKLILGCAKEVLALVRLFKGEFIDVLHVNVHGYEVAGIAARVVGVPCVAVYHIAPVAESSAVRKWLIRKTANWYDHVVFVSQWCEDAWRDIVRIPQTRTSVIYNGVCSAAISQQKVCRRRTDERFEMVCVGRLHPMKGLLDVIRAVQIANDSRLHVTILGDGVMKSLLMSFVAQNRMEASIAFLGHVENVRDFMKGADCLVQASVSHESFGLAVAEAMMVGLPVITSDFGPFPEINIHEGTGLVARVRDPESISQAMLRLANQPDLCATMGSRGHSRAGDLFTLSRMIAEMLNLYGRFKRTG